MNLTRNILTTLGTRLATMALALISSIILARILGPEGRGLFALILILPELMPAWNQKRVVPWYGNRQLSPVWWEGSSRLSARVF
jgi:hypothetical protein